MVGQPEQMFVAVFGLSVVVMLSQDNLFKGCMVAIVTLLIATFGQDPVEGFPRFTYGFSELTGGFSVVPVLIGLFSLPEVFKMLEDPFGKMAESGKVGSMKLKLENILKNNVMIMNISPMLTSVLTDANAIPKIRNTRSRKKGI